MPRRHPFPLLAFIFALALGARAVVAYVPPPSLSPRGVSLAGQLLVANPRMVEPTFAQTVVYLIRHTESGAMGLVVNRVYGTSTLQAVLAAFGIRTGETRLIDLHYGGPVEVRRGFVLHSRDYAGTGTQALNKDLALSTDLAVMQAMAEGHGPKRWLLLLGYAGWAAGQLEHEVARNDWLIAPADEKLIFSDDPKSTWEQALKRAGIPL